MNAREQSDHLAALLGKEHGALAEFVVALAVFDRERLWEQLGYTSLFVFLHRELGLSKGAAFYRKTAAELVQQFPEIVEPLRDGRLCITSMVELAKVLTPENRAEVLPRFFHRSKQEAKEITAELRPADAPPRRDVVTAVPAALPHVEAAVRAEPLRVQVQPENLVRANSADLSWVAPATPQRDLAEPVSAELRRLHITVSRRFLTKLEAAKDALSHALPGATSEEVLEACLDLMLAKQASRKGVVEKPRKTSRPPATDAIPAEVKRDVWKRAGGCCEWELPSGGRCGSTVRLEFDHVQARAHGGPSTVENLRLLCRAHHDLVTRRMFGDAWIDRFARGRARKPAATGPAQRASPQPRSRGPAGPPVPRPPPASRSS